MSRRTKQFRRIQEVVKKEEIKIDLGCGSRKKEGFIGVDILKFEGVDIVLNIGTDKWPWKNDSVTEAHASHFIEHLTAWQRVHFCNELYRVLIPGGKLQFAVPHWASCRAYGDPTHAWPPVSEFWFYYLNKEWRRVNAPHTDIEHEPRGFDCDFDFQCGYSLREDVAVKNVEYQQFAISNYKEVALDIIGTIAKREVKK